MNSYSIRFTHWLFRVRNDTVKHRNSCDIYFKGFITNNFLITILFLLRLLLYCSPTFFSKQIAKCKSSTYSDRFQRNWMLLAGPPEFLSLSVPQTFLCLFPFLFPCFPCFLPSRICPTLGSKAGSCQTGDALMQVMSCCLKWDLELQLTAFEGGWKAFQFECECRGIFISVLSDRNTHADLPYF